MSYVSWKWRKMQNLKRNWLVQNWHEEFNKFWPEHSKISKICTLMGRFWPKYIMLQLKKYRGVILMAFKIDKKISKKTALLFQKWQKFGEFWSEHSKVSKICTLMVPSGNVLPKNVKGSYLSWQQRVMKHLKKNWVLV